MKNILKLVLITILSTAILTSCSGKWQRDISDMPEGLRQQHEEVLAENLAILEEGDSLKAALEVAYRYQQLGDYKKAIEYYEKCLEYNVSYDVALNNLADIYEEVGEYDIAAAYIMRLFEVRQGSEEATKDAVRILLKADDALNAQAALDNYAGIMLLDPNDEGYSYHESVIQELQSSIDAWQETKQ